MAEDEDYRDLIAWQRSKKLLSDVYELVSYVPDDDLANALRRTVTNIPANIADGQKTKDDLDTQLFYFRKARSALFELSMHLQTTAKEYPLLEEETDFCYRRCHDIEKILRVKMDKLQQRIKGDNPEKHPRSAQRTYTDGYVPAPKGIDSVYIYNDGYVPPDVSLSEEDDDDNEEE